MHLLLRRLHLTSAHLWRRSLLTQEGICLTLAPGFRFLEVAYPYIARRLLTDEDPILRERLFEVRPGGMTLRPEVVLFTGLSLDGGALLSCFVSGSAWGK